MFQGFLKLSTTKNAEILMLDSADHVTGKAGLTLTMTASKDGAAFASITPTVTDLGSGIYSLALTTTHANTLGDFVIHITSAGADPADYKWQVVNDLPGNVLGDTAGTTTLLSRIASSLSLSGGAVTVGTNNDKTGYGLSAAAIQAIWDALTSALTTVGSIGKLLVSNIDTTISSRSVYAGADTSGTTTLLGRIASALSISGGAVTVGTNNDKTGYALTITPATAADVLTQVNSALDAVSVELAAVPTTVSSLRLRLNFLFEYFRNKKTVTATTETLFKEDAATTLGTSTVADDGTTFTKGEMN